MKQDNFQFDNLIVSAFFDRDTSTMSYIVSDRSSGDALIIDPVLNFDVQSGKTWKDSVNELCDYVSKEALDVKMIIETHAHADHLTGACELKSRFPNASVAISEKIIEVQKIFNEKLELGISCDGSQFDKLLKDCEVVKVGSISFEVLNTPGHTPACTSLLFGSFLFSGDALFMPDYGTGRCDFPAGSSKDLYQSITNKIYSLNDDVAIFVGHDYCPGGRELMYRTTVGESKKENIRLTSSTSEGDFIEFRDGRDKNLNTPKLLYPSIQININGGQVADLSKNGNSFIKIPIVGM